MMRWRYCLLLALVMLLPTRAICRDNEDDEDHGDEGDENDEDDEDDDDEPSVPKKGEHVPGRRASGTLDPASQRLDVTRTTQKRPLECFVCAYKSETPLRACLDPTKFRVHTVTCHSTEEMCFTQALSKGSALEAVIRGCRSNCVGNADTTCCESNRCNSQAFAMPVRAQSQKTMEELMKDAQAAAEYAKKMNKMQGIGHAGKASPPGILLFVTVLLVVQAVVKVMVV